MHIGSFYANLLTLQCIQEEREFYLGWWLQKLPFGLLWSYWITLAEIWELKNIYISVVRHFNMLNCQDFDQPFNALKWGSDQYRELVHSL